MSRIEKTMHIGGKRKPHSSAFHGD
jgi:hypothetical protein